MDPLSPVKICINNKKVEVQSIVEGIDEVLIVPMVHIMNHDDLRELLLGELPDLTPKEKKAGENEADTILEAIRRRYKSSKKGKEA